MLRALLIVLSFLVFCDQRVYASVMWLNDNRRVEHQSIYYSGDGYTSTDRPSAPYAAWNAACQLSDIGPDHITATITSSGAPLFGWVMGTYRQVGYTRLASYVDVDFRLTEATPYTLNLNPPSSILVPWGCAITDSLGQPVGGSGTSAGVLPAGDYNYRLYIGAGEFFSGQGNALFTLIVPEPASLSLLAVSMAILLARPRASRGEDKVSG